MTDDADQHVALRLKALREKAGLSVRAAASAMKMASSTYGHYEDPKRLKGPLLPIPFARKFASVIAGHGGDPDEVMLLAGVSRGEAGAEVLDRHHDAELVPVYDVEVSAGPGVFAPEAETIVDHISFPPGYLSHITDGAALRDLAIVTVKGVSMSPTLNPGDVVMIDRTKTNLGFDGLFVLRFGDVLHVKRIGRSPKKAHVSVISDNPAQGAYDAHVSDVEPVGKVLWYGRKE